MTSISVSLALSAPRSPAVCSAAIAGNPFRGMTTTEGGYHTWDSDLINIEGLRRRQVTVFTSPCSIPAWCRTGATISRRPRVAALLGTGFDQPVSFRASKTEPCGLEVEVGQLHSSTWVGSTGLDAWHACGEHHPRLLLSLEYRRNRRLPAAANHRTRRIAPDGP